MKRFFVGFLCFTFLIQQTALLPALAESTITGVANGTSGAFNINPDLKSGDTGFKYYNSFNLGQGDIANLIFQMKNNGGDVSKFVNLVNNQIVINGILNSVGGDGAFYNGHAIFVSPNGMVVGASGVINVGALTAIAPNPVDFAKYAALSLGTAGSETLGNEVLKVAGREDVNIGDYLSYLPVKNEASLAALKAADQTGDVVVNGKIFARNNVELYGKNVAVGADSTSKNTTGIFAGVKTSATGTQYNQGDLISSTTQAENLFKVLVSNNDISNGAAFGVNGEGKIEIKAQSVKDIGSISPVDKFYYQVGDKLLELTEDQLNTKINEVLADLVSDVTAKQAALTEAQNNGGDVEAAQTALNVAKATLETAKNEQITKSIASTTKKYLESSTSAANDAKSIDKNTATVKVQNATLGGQDVNLTAQSVVNYTAQKNDPMTSVTDSSAIGNMLQSALITETGKILGMEDVVGQGYDYEGARAKATVEVGSGSNIFATHDVNLSSEAVANTNLVIKNRFAPWVDTSAELYYATGDKTISTIDVTGDAVVKAANNVVVNAKSVNTQWVKIKNPSSVTEQILAQSFSVPNFQIILLNAKTEATTRANIAEGTTVEARALDVSAVNTTNDLSILNAVSSISDKSAATSIAITIKDATIDTQAIIDGTVTTTGDTSVTAQNLHTAANINNATVETDIGYKAKLISAALNKAGSGVKSLISKVAGNVIDEGIFNELFKAEANLPSASLSVLYNNSSISTVAKVGKHSTITADNVNIKANTIDLTVNNVAAKVKKEGETKTSSVSLPSPGIAVSISNQNNTTSAYIEDGDSTNHAVVNANGAVNISATSENPMNEATFEFLLNLSKLGASAYYGVGNLKDTAGNVIDDVESVDYRELLAALSNTTDPLSDALDGVFLDLTMSGLTSSLGLKGFFNNWAESGSGIQTGGVGVAGSVVYTSILNNTLAKVGKSANLNVQDLVVNAVNKTTQYNAVGDVGKLWSFKDGSSGSSGLGGSVLIQEIDNNADAVIADNAKVTATDKNANDNYKGGNVKVQSANSQDYISLVVTGGKATSDGGVAMTGSVVVQDVKGNTNSSVGSAVIDAVNMDVVAGQGDISLVQKASDDLGGMFTNPFSPTSVIMDGVEYSVVNGVLVSGAGNKLKSDVTCTSNSIESNGILYTLTNDGKYKDSNGNIFQDSKGNDIVLKDNKITFDDVEYQYDSADNSFKANGDVLKTDVTVSGKSICYNNVTYTVNSDGEFADKQGNVLSGSNNEAVTYNNVYDVDLSQVDDDSPSITSFAGIGSDGKIGLNNSKSVKDGISNLMITGAISTQSTTTKVKNGSTTQTPSSSSGVAVGASVGFSEFHRNVSATIADAANVTVAENLNVIADTFTKSLNIALAGAFAGGAKKDEPGFIDKQKTKLKNKADGYRTKLIGLTSELSGGLIGGDSKTSSLSSSTGASPITVDGVKYSVKGGKYVDDAGKTLKNADGTDALYKGSLGDTIPADKAASAKSGADNMSAAAAGALNIQLNESTAQAKIGNATIKVGKDLKVSAIQTTNALNVSTGLAKAATVGAGAALNYVKNSNTTLAQIGDKTKSGNAIITFDDSKTGAHKLDVTANEDNSNIEVALGVGASKSNEQNSSATQVAAGGSFNADVLKNNVTANIENAQVSSTTIGSKNIAVNVDAENYSKSFKGAGGFAYTGSQSKEGTSVGAGMSANLNLINKTTNAKVESSTINNATTLDVTANKDASKISEDLISVAVAGAVMTGAESAYSFVGAFGVDVISNIVLATVKDSTLYANGAANVAANDYIRNWNIPGAVSLSTTSKGAGIGIGTVVDVITNNLTATVDNSTIDTPSRISIKANENEFLNFIAANMGISTSGSSEITANAIVNVLNSTITSGIVNSSDVKSNSYVDVISNYYNELNLGTVVGAISLDSGNAGAGNIIANILQTTNTAKVENSDVNAKGKLTVNAISEDNITSTPAAVAVTSSGKVAGAANISANVVKNKTEAFVNGKADKKANITSNGLDIKAQDNTTSRTRGGTLAATASGTVSLAGSLIADVYVKDIDAYIDNAILNEGKGGVSVSASAENVFGVKEPTSITASAIASQIKNEGFSWTEAANLLNFEMTYDISGSGGSAALAGSINTKNVINDVNSHIGSGTTIKNAGAIDVNASNFTYVAGIVGNISASSGSAAVGGALFSTVNVADVNAYIDENAIIGSADSMVGAVNVSASSLQEYRTIMLLTGASNSAAVNGTLNSNVIVNETNAYIAKGVDLYSNSTVNVNAKDSADIQSINLAVSAAGSAAVGGIGYANVLAERTNASIGKVGDALNTKKANIIANNDVTVSSDSSQDFSANMLMVAGSGSASVSGVAIATTVAAQTSAKVDNANVASKNGKVDVKASNRYNDPTKSANIVQFIKNKANSASNITPSDEEVSESEKANRKNATLSTEELADNKYVKVVDSKGNITYRLANGDDPADSVISLIPLVALMNIAGAGSAAVTGNLVANVVVSNVDAEVTNSTINSLSGLNIDAATSVTTYDSIVGVAGSAYASVGANGITNVAVNQTNALLQNSTVESGDASVTASDKLNFNDILFMAAGAGEGAGVTAIANVNTIVNKVNAIADKAIINNGNLNVAANNDVDTLTAGVAIAGAGIGAGVAGVVMNNTIVGTQNATIKNHSDIKNGSATVKSTNTVDMNDVIIGGTLGGIGAGVGIYTPVNVVANNINASLEDSDVSNNKDTKVEALSDVNIWDISAVVAVSGIGASVSGTVFVNVIDNAINSVVKNSTITGGDTSIAAKQNTSMTGGVFALNAGGVGASVGVNAINNTFLDRVNAYSDNSTYRDSSLAVSGEAGDTINMYLASLAGTGLGGAVNASGIVNVINNKLNSYATGGTFEGATEGSKSTKELKATATQKTNLSNNAASVGIGAGAAGVGATVNVITNEAKANISDMAVNTSSDVSVSADSTENVTNYVGAVNAGGFAAGLLTNVNVIENTTQAYINSKNKNVIANDISVGAKDKVSSQNISVIGSAGGTAASAGITVNVINNAVKAELLSTGDNGALLTGKYTANDVNVSADSDFDIDVNTASASAGMVGLSGAIAVTSLGSRFSAPTSDESYLSSADDSNTNVYAQVESKTAKNQQTTIVDAKDSRDNTGATSLYTKDYNATNVNLTETKKMDGTVANVKANVDYTGKMNVAASNKSDVKTGNIAVAVSGSVGGGATVLTSTSKYYTTAKVSGGNISGKNNASDLKVQATNDVDADSDAVSAGVGTYAIAGNVAVFVNDSVTQALVENADINTLGKASILAISDDVIDSKAASLSAGGVAASFNVAVANTTNKVITNVSGTNLSANGIDIISTNTSDLDSTLASASIGAATLGVVVNSVNSNAITQAIIAGTDKVVNANGGDLNLIAQTGGISAVAKMYVGTITLYGANVDSQGAKVSSEFKSSVEGTATAQGQNVNMLAGVKKDTKDTAGEVTAQVDSLKGTIGYVSASVTLENAKVDANANVNVDSGANVVASKSGNVRLLAKLKRLASTGASSATLGAVNISAMRLNSEVTGDSTITANGTLKGGNVDLDVVDDNDARTKILSGEITLASGNLNYAKAKVDTNSKITTGNIHANNVDVNVTANKDAKVDNSSFSVSLISAGSTDIETTVSGQSGISTTGTIKNYENSGRANSVVLNNRETATAQNASMSGSYGLVSGKNLSMTSTADSSVSNNIGGSINANSVDIDSSLVRTTIANAAADSAGLGSINKMTLTSKIGNGSTTNFSGAINTDSLTINSNMTNAVESYVYQSSKGLVALAKGSVLNEINNTVKNIVSFNAGTDINAGSINSDASTMVSTTSNAKLFKQSGSYGLFAISGGLLTNTLAAQSILNFNGGTIKTTKIDDVANFKITNVASTPSKMIVDDHIGGFTAKGGAKLSNTINQESHINVNNGAKVIAAGTLNIGMNTGAQGFEQSVSSNASGGFAYNNATSSVTANIKNYVNVNNGLLQGKVVNINMDSTNSLGAEAYVHTSHIFGQPSVSSYVTLNVDNNVTIGDGTGDFDAKILATSESPNGVAVNINYMANSNQTITQIADVWVQAAVASADYGGDINFNTNNNLNIKTDGHVASSKDVNVLFKRGTENLNSRIHYKKISRALFGIKITKEGSWSSTKVAASNKAVIDGKVEAGAGTSMTMKIDKNGNVVASDTTISDSLYEKETSTTTVMTPEEIAEEQANIQNQITDLSGELKALDDAQTVNKERATAIQSQLDALNTQLALVTYTTNLTDAQKIEIDAFKKSLSDSILSNLKGLSFETTDADGNKVVYTVSNDSKLTDLAKNLAYDKDENGDNASFIAYFMGQVDASSGAIKSEDGNYTNHNQSGEVGDVTTVDDLSNYLNGLNATKSVYNKSTDADGNVTYSSTADSTSTVSLSEATLLDDATTSLANIKANDIKKANVTQNGETFEVTTYLGKTIIDGTTDTDIAAAIASTEAEKTDLASAMTEVSNNIIAVSNKILDYQGLYDNIGKDNVSGTYTNGSYKFANLNATGGSINIKSYNGSASKVSGSGSLIINVADVLIDNYSNYNLVFKGLTVASGASGVFIDGVGYSGSKEGKKIRENNLRVFTQGNDDNAGSITINDYYDPTHPTNNSLIGNIASNIIINGIVDTNSGNVNIWNEGGNIAINNSINAEKITINVPQGDYTQNTKGQAYKLKAEDSLFAGGKIDITASTIDIQGTMRAGNADRNITITDSMLANLTNDYVTCKDNLIKLIDDSTTKAVTDSVYMKDTDNIKALYDADTNTVTLFGINIKDNSTINLHSTAAASTETTTVTNPALSPWLVNLYEKLGISTTIVTTKSTIPLVIGSNANIQSANGYGKINIINNTNKNLVVNGVTNNYVTGGIKYTNLKNNTYDLVSLIQDKNSAINAAVASIVNGAVKTETLDAMSDYNKQIVANDNTDSLKAAAVSDDNVNTINNHLASSKTTNDYKQSAMKNISKGSQAGLLTTNATDTNIVIDTTGASENQTGDLSVKGTISSGNVNDGKFNLNLKTNGNLNILTKYVSGNSGTQTPVINTNGTVTLDKLSSNGGVNIEGLIKNANGTVTVNNAGNSALTIDSLGEISNTNGSILLNNTGAQGITVAGKLNVIGAVTDNVVELNNTNAVAGINVLQNALISNVSANAANSITLSSQGAQGVVVDGNIASENGGVKLSSTLGDIDVNSNANIKVNENNTLAEQALDIENTSTAKGIKISGKLKNFGKGNLNITNNGTEDTNIAATANVESASGGNVVIFKKNAGGITISGMVKNAQGDNIVTKESGSGAVLVSGKLLNEKGDTTLTNKTATEGTVIASTGKIENSNGLLKIENKAGSVLVQKDGDSKGLIKNTNGNLEIINSGSQSDSKINIAGNVERYGNGELKVSNYAQGGIDISGAIQNAVNTMSILNDVAASSGIVISGIVDNLNGALDIYNNSATGTDGINISGTAQNAGGNLTISNNKADITITGTVKNLVNSNKGGDLGISNTATAGSIVFAGASVSNAKGNTSITNNGSNIIEFKKNDTTAKETSVSNSNGKLSILNKGANGINIQDSTYVSNNGGTLDIINETTASKGISIKGSSTVTNAAGTLTVDNKSTVDTAGILLEPNATITNNNGKIIAKNVGKQGIKVQGRIKSVDNNVEVTNQDSDIVIGDSALTLDNTNNTQGYIAAAADVVINQTNGDILNGLYLNDLAGTYSNYDLGQPNNHYQTLISAKNLEMTVIDGDIGQTDNARPGFSIDKKTRNYTESINVNVVENITAKALNNTKTDNRLVNLRSRFSNMKNVDVTSNGNVILTAADWKQSDADKGTSEYNKDGYLNGFYMNGKVEGQDISMITSHNLDMTVNQRTDINPLAYVSFEAENDVNVVGSNKGDMNLWQAISKHGSMDLTFSGNTVIRALTAGEHLHILNKGKNLTIYDLGIIPASMGFEDMLYPHDKIAMTGSDWVVPKSITIEVLDLWGGNTAESTLNIYNAYLKGRDAGDKTPSDMNGILAPYIKDLGLMASDVTIKADNMIAHSKDAPDSIVGTISNPAGFNVDNSDRSYFDDPLTGKGPRHDATGFNSYGIGAGDSISFDIRGVNPNLINAYNDGATNIRTQFLNQPIITTLLVFTNPKYIQAPNYKMSQVSLTLNQNNGFATQNRGMLIDRLYADDAYINTGDLNLDIVDGMIGRYGEFKNGNRGGSGDYTFRPFRWNTIVDNDYRRKIDEVYSGYYVTLQLFTKKTGSFGVSMGDLIVMETMAPPVAYNPYEVTNLPRNENSFYRQTYKDDKIQETTTTPEFKDLDKSTNGQTKRDAIRFESNDVSVSSNGASGIQVYNISKTGMEVDNVNNAKVGDKITLEITIDGDNIKVDAQVMRANDGKIGVKFTNLDKATANKILYMNMLSSQAKDKKISKL
ncbi:MAG: PilZ domain-containing protein [Candidatus Gastranaerophilales bacterium]|nr:PilZ domain-containing protein [Candidatus Gastranaerophilales bacterium]